MLIIMLTIMVNDADDDDDDDNSTGARWLQATNFQPNIIYLDSAHEIDETYYELCRVVVVVAVVAVVLRRSREVRGG